LAQIVNNPGTPPEAMSTAPRQQRVVHHVRTVECHIADLHLGYAQRFGVLLKQVLVLHDVELEVAHAELLGEPHLRHIGAGSGTGREAHGEQPQGKQPQGKQRCRSQLHAPVPSVYP
jgi:hypothetical protein